jgi:hypothetical protein
MSAHSTIACRYLMPRRLPSDLVQNRPQPSIEALLPDSLDHYRVDPWILASLFYDRLPPKMRGSVVAELTMRPPRTTLSTQMTPFGLVMSAARLK